MQAVEATINIADDEFLCRNRGRVQGKFWHSRDRVRLFKVEALDDVRLCSHGAGQKPVAMGEDEPVDVQLVLLDKFDIVVFRQFVQLNRLRGDHEEILSIQPEKAQNRDARPSLGVFAKSSLGLQVGKLNHRRGDLGSEIGLIGTKPSRRHCIVVGRLKADVRRSLAFRPVVVGKPNDLPVECRNKLSITMLYPNCGLFGNVEGAQGPDQLHMVNLRNLCLPFRGPLWGCRVGRCFLERDQRQ